MDPFTDAHRARLVAARQQSGMTQAKLAQALGVDVTTLARWERGDASPSTLARRAIKRRFPDVFRSSDPL